MSRLDRGPQHHVEERNRKSEEPENQRSSRYLEMRVKEIEPHFHMNYNDPLHVPKVEGMEDWVMKWGRKSIKGEPDVANETRMSSRGWVPVRPSSFPELRRLNTFNPAIDRDTIEHSDVILVMRPKKFEEDEEEETRKLNYKVMTSMPGTENFMGQRGIPAHMMHNELNVGRQADYQG